MCVWACVCLSNKILKVESGPNRISTDERVWAVRGKWLTGDSKQVLVIDAISGRRAALGAGKCSLQGLATRGQRGGHRTPGLWGLAEMSRSKEERRETI